MKQFHWKRNSKIGKVVCPACKHKTLVRYKHQVTNEIAEDVFGCCDRVYACGYINRPPEKPLPPQAPVFIPPPTKTDYTDYSVVKASISNPTNNLFRYCVDKFGLLRTRQVFKEYLTGDSIKKPGACTFWFKDREGLIRGGMICEYDETGHRRGNNMWEHDKAYTFVLCNFGDHLVDKYPDRTIHVVEAPKTAILASLKYPDALWIATNGLTTLQEGRCDGLRGRDVVLFPDREPDEFPDSALWLKDYWKKKGEELRKITKTLTIFEGLDFEKEGTDIADLI